MTYRLLIRLLIVAMLASCAARGELFKGLESPTTGQAVLYIYRTQYVERSMDLSPGITVNGIEVGALPLDGYLRVPVAPGATEVRMKNRAYLWPSGAPLESVKLDVRPGQMQFVEFSVEKSKAETQPLVRTLYLGVSLREVSQETALRFLPKLKNAN